MPGANQAIAPRMQGPDLRGEEVEASVIAEYEARMAALERKLEQLTMEMDIAKKKRDPGCRP